MTRSPACQERSAGPRADLGAEIRSLAWRDYLILFRYAGEDVEVIRIVHGQRDLPRIVNPSPDA